MNKIFKLVSAVIILVASIGIFSACKKTFDAPPGAADPNIVANRSIEQLKTLHVNFGVYDLITEDIIITGIVVANDKSGNFYKQLFIQDSTGAMQIKIDANSLYGAYPVGRRVFIKCKGLTLTDENSTMVLGIKAIISGSPSIEGIPGNVLSQYLIGGSLNNPVVPIPVTLADLQTSLNNKYINALIRLDGYEFAAADTLKTYSDTSAYKITENRIISTGCGVGTGGQVIVRNSAYANFAALPIPKGNGSINAIYTVYRFSATSTATKQLIIRDTADVQFTGARCGAPPPGTVVLLNEDFETQTITTSPTPYAPITVTGWTNLSEAASVLYTARTFSSNKYAYVSGFGTGAPAVTTWLVTKGVDLSATTTETLTFKTMQGFILTTTPGGTPVQAALKVLVSTNFTGTGNPWAAGVTWTDITTQAALSPGSTTSTFPSSFTSSGNIDLSSYTGTLYVAFRYEGADPAGTASDKTSAWEVDDIRITGL